MVEIPSIAYIIGAPVLCLLLTCCICSIICSILKFCINKREKIKLEKRENQEAAARDRRRRRRRSREQQSELNSRAIYQQPTAMQTRPFRLQQSESLQIRIYNFTYK